jgi:hypothetical protein
MMKRVLLFTLLVSFFGYSQNPIQPNHSSFNDGLTQDLVEKTKPFDLEFKDDEMMDSNPIGRVNGMKPQSFQKPGNVQENEFKLRLFHYKGGTFSKENKQPETQYERFYDEDGNITLEINENWDIETQSYVIIDKKEYTYDENGNQTYYISYDWDTETQSFYPSVITEYIYDNNGNQIMFSTNYNWDTVNQSWGYGSKSEETYDENGNQTYYISYDWDTETQSFYPSVITEYIYDNNGNQIMSSNNSDWDTVNQSWGYGSKYEVTYDENGNQTLYISYNWNTDTQSFEPGEKYEYTFDDNGKITSTIGSSNWDTGKQHFVTRSKRLWTWINYSNGEILFDSYDISFWYDELGIYKPGLKSQYYTSLDDENELHRTGTNYVYDTNFNTWNDSGDNFSKYIKEYSLSTNSVEPNLFSIYPNPTSNTLQINSSEYLKTPIFELYDVKGSKILSNPFKLTEPIDVSDLQPSMYIYYVKDDNEVKQSGKVLIE